MGCADTETLTIGAGSTLGRAFIANSGYLLTSTQSVAGWVEMMTLYTKAFVLGGRLTIKISCAQPSTCVSVVSTKPTLPATVQDAIEAGRSSWSLSVPGSPPISLVTTWDVAEIFSKRDVLDDPELWGTVTSAPINQFYNYLMINNPVAYGNAVTFAWQCELTMMFVDPNPVDYA